MNLPDIWNICGIPPNRSLWSLVGMICRLGVAYTLSMTSMSCLNVSSVSRISSMILSRLVLATCTFAVPASRLIALSCDLKRLESVRLMSSAAFILVLGDCVVLAGDAFGELGATQICGGAGV